MAARGRRSISVSKSATNLLSGKHLRFESDQNSASGDSTLFSQQKLTQSTGKLVRRNSFGLKAFTEDGKDPSTLLKSFKSTPDLSQSTHSSIATVTSLGASGRGPHPTRSPAKPRVCQRGLFQRLVQRDGTNSTNSSRTKSSAEDSEGSRLASSLEETITKLKSKGPREVPSRFMESATTEKKMHSKASVTSSGFGLKKLNKARKTLKLHSTGLEESMLPPNWDLSFVQSESTEIRNPENTMSILETSLCPMSEADAIEQLEFDAILYMYMAVMREENLVKYQDKAERNLLLIEEENELLRREVFHPKQDQLLREKERQLCELMDQQMEILREVVRQVQLFGGQYKALGQALDVTRHSLQTKNILIPGGTREYLEQLKSFLKVTKGILDGFGLGTSTENHEALAGIKDLRELATKTEVKIKSYLTEVEAMASWVSRESALLHQEVDEQDLGMEALAGWIFK
uniref:HAUS augmin like complex subunit 8 n=1 Tax=Callorhinchus milii TaxID=7868 RepID=A0A4W3GV89_CALMI|eukprot:gi/632961766/ref/XP_007896942.1/ PREDICTED: HAUS augmin-like complex subunit 8 isoform X1 [Callorhinchus milii]